MNNDIANVRDLLIEAAGKYGGRPAFIYQDSVYDFARVRDDVFRLANGLKDLQLDAGDKVLVYLPNCIEYAYAYQVLN